MIDTTVIAAYAAQYAKACKTEPRVAYWDNELVGLPYTYMLIDDITPFLSEDDSLFTKAKDYGFELHNYEDGSMKLYIVPNHEQGGEHMANRTEYCGSLEFKESKKANEANIRNAVFAARTLIQRHIDCTELYNKLPEIFHKPVKTELCAYILGGLDKSYNLIESAKHKYAKYLDEVDGSNVDNTQVINGVCILDNLRKNCGVVKPFMEVDPCGFRHLIENAMKLNPDFKDNAYLTNDSCAIAVAIFMEDKFSSKDIADTLKVPAIYGVLNALGV